MSTVDPIKKYAQTMAKPLAATQNSSLPSAASNYINTMKSPTQNTANTNPVSRTDQTLNKINDLTNQSYTFTKPKEFSYDQNSDPAYQAALSSARQNIAQNQADTNARLRAGGQGRSSYSESVANQIGAKEMGRVSTDVLPQLISQAYQKYVDEANRDFAVQQANYGVSQDKINNYGNLYGLQYQQDVTRPMAEAQLTGQYLSGEARQYINAINSLKEQYGQQGTTAEQRAALTSEADKYRAALTGMGIDSGLFGANVNLNDSRANVNRAGIQTLNSRTLDENIRQYDQNFAAQQERYAVQDQQWQQNFGVTLAQVTGFMPDGTPTSAQQQQELSNLWMVADQTGVIPNQLATMYGLQPGTPTFQAKTKAAELAISQQHANASTTSAAATYMNAVTNKNQETRLSSTSKNSSSSSSKTASSISAKESYNNYNVLLDDIRKAGSRERAMQLLQANAEYLLDSDYKNLGNQINKYYEG